MNAPAFAPARFDRGAQHRRAMLAKIHVARKDLAMEEDDYRQILFDQTGKLSAGDCDERQLAKVLDALKAKGFRPVPKGRKSGVAQHPMARKARALWISLHHLGLVHNPSEEALEAMAKRQLGCERLVWARQSDAFRLIEALKEWGKRKGWAMHDAAGKPLGVVALKESLCLAILARLRTFGVVPAHWGLHDAAWKLCGIENAREQAWTASDYDQLAAALGKHLRDAPGFGERRDANQGEEA